MRYFVTGATGFIGSHVARQLLAGGHEVVAVARTPAKAQDLADLGAEIHAGDITDKESMRGPMTGVDGVFHIAAWYEIGVRDSRLMERINIDGTRYVLELMRELGIPKGVYTSTVGVFSDTGGELKDESHRHTGGFVSHYERTKWIAHYEVAEPMMRDGLPLVIVMPGLVYGPGDTSMVHDMMRDWIRGRLPAAPRGAAFCWAHVDDTARAHILAMEKGTPGESYIIAGQPATLAEVLQIGEREYGFPAPRVTLPPALLKGMAGVMSVVEKVVPVSGSFAAESLRTIAGVTYLGSNAKARRELGFDPRPLEDGLCETAEYEMEQLGITPPARRGS